MKPFRIAEKITITGIPIGYMGGDFIVEDVEEHGNTTTYKLVRPGGYWGQWGDLL